MQGKPSFKARSIQHEIPKSNLLQRRVTHNQISCSDFDVLEGVATFPQTGPLQATI